MRVHTYTIDHDLGFAPNPFHRVCTLSSCKPGIRQYADIGDVVAGLGSKPNGMAGHLVYWMKVGEVLSFDQYWLDERFRVKRPTMVGSRMLRYGDNIYHRGADGRFVQEDSFHSEEGGLPSEANLKRDTGQTDKVLVGWEYAYWGRSGPKVPDSLSDFVHQTQGHKNRFLPDRIEAFAGWLATMPARGFLGRPANWPGGSGAERPASASTVP